MSERQRHRVQMEEGQRERETQSSKQAAGSKLSAQNPMWGTNSRTARAWPESKPVAQPTEPPRRLFFYFIFKFVCLFIYLFIYLFLEIETFPSQGGAEREGDRENPKQAVCCPHRARCGALTQKKVGSYLSQNPSSDTESTEPPRCPRKHRFYVFKIVTCLFCVSLYPLFFPHLCLFLFVSFATLGKMFNLKWTQRIQKEICPAYVLCI